MTTRYPRSEAFWRARDSWYTSRLAAQSKARGLRANVDIRRQRAKWEANAARYLRGKHAHLYDPDWMSTNGAEFSREILALIGDAQPETAAALDHVASQVAFDVWREWPVSSGLSKSMLDLQYSVKGGDLVATLASRAPYTTFIKDQPHRRLMDAAMAARGGMDARVATLMERRRALTGRGR